MKTQAQLAYPLALFFHEGQNYGDTTYVLGHLVPVSLTAKMIAEGLNLSEEEVDIVEASAFLHDIVEDTSCSIHYLRDVESINLEVSKTVWSLTKDSCLSYNNYLGIVVQGGLYPIIVKLADSICNHRACLVNGNIKRALKYSSNIDFLTTALSRENEKRNKN